MLGSAWNQGFLQGQEYRAGLAIPSTHGYGWLNKHGRTGGGFTPQQVLLSSPRKRKGRSFRDILPGQWVGE